ncbi:MAG: biopolymer transporter ExbD [Phycisphaerae bacterium]|jgi:biopolymer transport protein ExbD
MRYRRDDRHSDGVLAFNATPLVDVIFLLTIFFMLVTRFSSAEQVPMELPKPTDSKAEVTSMPERVVINCRLADTDDPAGRDVLYSIGPNRPERLSVISDRLAVMKRSMPDLKVVVRADRRLRYSDVRRVMRVIARHKVRMLNVVAHVGEDQ